MRFLFPLRIRCRGFPCNLDPLDVLCALFLRAERCLVGDNHKETLGEITISDIQAVFYNLTVPSYTLCLSFCSLIFMEGESTVKRKISSSSIRLEPIFNILVALNRLTWFTYIHLLGAMFSLWRNIGFRSKTQRKWFLLQSICTFIVNPEENKLKRGFSKALLDINTLEKMWRKSISKMGYTIFNIKPLRTETHYLHNFIHISWIWMQ